MTPDDWTHEGRRIEDEIEIGAPPEHVWAAWADPTELARWFVDRASGTAEPGGEIVWAWDAYEIEQTLEVVEADEGQRLVLSVGWGEGTPTILEVTLDPAEHGTRLRLVHSGFLDDGSWDGEYEGAKSGWTNALAHLKHYLERHRGREKTSVDIVEPAVYEIEAVLEATRTREGLASWLGRAKAGLGSIGDPVHIDLASGGTLTGEVLAMTDWETVLTWTEIDGALTFQAFPGERDIEHGERMLGLRAVSWASEDAVSSQREPLGAALERLVEIVET